MTEEPASARMRYTAPRVAYLAIGSVVIGFSLNAFLAVLLAPSGVYDTVLAGLALTCVGALQLGVLSNPRVRSSSPRARAAFLAVVVLAFAPVLEFGDAWLGVPGFAAGSALLVLPRRVRWWVFALVCLSAGALAAADSPDPVDTAYNVCITAVTGLTLDGLSRLRHLVRRLRAAQDELAAVSATRERLRFARDVQVLVSDQLSRIEVLGELVLRILRRSPEQADTELSEIVRVAQRALDTVRSVASGYRDHSLDQSLASVRSVLEASHIEVTVHEALGGLPRAAQTLGAALLHEAVDTLLAHTQVTRCDITCTLALGVLRVELVHDGLPFDAADPGPTPAADQARDAGGTVSAETLPDGRRRVRARVPVAKDWWVLSRFGRPGGHTGGEAMEPSMARRLLQAVLLGHTVNSLLFVVDARPAAAQAVVALVCLAGVVGLQVGYFSRRPDPPVGPRAVALLGVQAVLVAIPILVVGDPNVGLPGFLAGSVLLVLRPPAAIPVLMVVVGGVAAAQVLLGGGAEGVNYGVLATLDHGLVIFGLGRLRGVVTGLQTTRLRLAESAAASERLRFARDLHDLLGLGLSAITLKSAVAQRLLGVAPTDRVHSEVEEILAVTRRARNDATSVTHRYRRLSLDDEIASVRSVLAAAEVELLLRLPETPVPPGVETVLATVLREAVCNVLRHSEAQRCEVRVTVLDTAARVIVSNDGPRGGGAATGSGLVGLTARLQEVSGVLEAGLGSDQVFRLTATVPLDAVTPPVDADGEGHARRFPHP